MQYYSLKSIVASQKAPATLHAPSESFQTPSERVAPYIEPTFSKEEFPTEKPAILLVSAVGASGKTTTARALAHDTGLPILDLAKHKPVGDNTLTGILTTAYPIEHVGSVLEGLRKGTQGIIIDGIDEGRSKTTEQGFEAFLDDLIERSKGAAATSIVVFGRGQVLLSTWFYLAEKGADVGLVRIDPFDLAQAKAYIDAYVNEDKVGQLAMYEQARDGVLEKLGAAFGSSAQPDAAFLSFIGYPPVLDAIATLLRTEPNYHRVSQELSDGATGQMEVGLLIRIADFLLDRERTEKALPNFIDSIASQADAALGQRLRAQLYSREEQCARILTWALRRPFVRQCVSDTALNARYEKALDTWFPEHPFLDDYHVRNPVFGAVAIARCALSTVPEYQAIAHEYAAATQPTYHLLYVMSALTEATEISARFFNMLIQSCSEFLGARSDINIDVSGVSWEDVDPAQPTAAELELSVSLAGQDHERTFKFNGTVVPGDVVAFGPYLVNTNVTVPCGVELVGSSGLECTGLCRVNARSVRIDTPDVIVRGISQGEDANTESGLFVNAEHATGHANAVSTKGATIEIGCSDHSLDYPLAKYVRRSSRSLADPALAEKFLRLRRIMLEFRSHKRGGLAKYRYKIEHERVLRNDLGRRVLAQLVNDGVLRADPKFYYVESERFSSQLGITWQQLRQHQSSAQLEAFLRRVT